MKKISKRAHIPHVSGGNGYTHDNGNVAFGHPEHRFKFPRPEKKLNKIQLAIAKRECG